MKIKNLPIVSVTGPSCSGKTTFVHKLIKTKFKSGLRFGEIVSHTTRQQRPNEIDGKDYYFITANKFLEMSIDDLFVEHVEFNKNSYAVSRQAIDNSFEGHQVPIVIVEPNGAAQIADYCKRKNLMYVSIFIDVDNKVAVRRFLNRDCGSVITDAALSRLDTMHTVERKWLETGTWNFIIQSYDETNKETIPIVFGELLWHILLAQVAGIYLNFENTYLSYKKAGILGR